MQENCKHKEKRKQPYRQKDHHPSKNQREEKIH